MARDFSEDTVMFKVKAEEINQAQDILMTVYAALKEKGYNPINQLVGYLLSGDPAYITSHGNARSMIKRLERDELMEELVRHYLDEK
ncbi:MAG: IreB family regulatory phosphoprotein [Firmicutes bacterium]|nr:IreB family regulatory phosphoprotein [Bacillota bacterium]